MIPFSYVIPGVLYNRYMHDTRSQQVVLITGASSGFGLAFAEQFAQLGYSVVMVASDKQRLLSAAQSIRSTASTRIYSIVQDLSTPGAAMLLYEKVAKERLSINVLVNNAGFGTSGEFIGIDYKREESEMYLNMVTLTLLTKLYLGDMKKMGNGKILNVASLAAFSPGPYMAVYYATKAYVLHFSEALGQELKDTDITVTTFCPGPTATNFAKTADVTKTGLFAKKLPTADASARVAIDGLLANRQVVYDNPKNHFIALIIRLLPRKFLLQKVAQINRR